MPEPPDGRYDRIRGTSNVDRAVADPSRMTRLRDIRAMIENGTYDTAERWEAALTCLAAAVDDRS